MTNKESKWLTICGLTSTVIIITLLVFSINSLDKSTKKAARANDVKVKTDNAYNMAHPEIVGTNEVGEVIKRYSVRYGLYHWHFIYEVGNTKTSNTPFGKNGLEVIAEKR